MWVYQWVSENIFHLVNECDQAWKSHTRARLYITACFKTIWHLHSGQDLVPLVSAIASKNIDGSNRKIQKKKRTLNTCKMFKMSSLSPFADLPFTFATQSHCLIESSLWWVHQKNARLKGSAGMSCGWPKAPGFHGKPSGTQTWLAGKSNIYGGLSNKTLLICRGFSIAMLQHVWLPEEHSHFC